MPGLSRADLGHIGDNGPDSADYLQVSNSRPFRDYSGSAFAASIRTRAIVRWFGHVQAGAVTNDVPHTGDGVWVGERGRGSGFGRGIRNRRHPDPGGAKRRDDHLRLQRSSQSPCCSSGMLMQVPLRHDFAH